MVRDHLFHKTIGADKDFRWRGGDISRIEAFADGIFAITVTLLIVSNASVEHFYDVWLLVRDLPAFFLSFAMIMYAWFEHYLFFRRYGLSDGFTIFLNALFLFLNMTLAYPLKLLTTFLWYLVIGQSTRVLFELPDDSTTVLTEFNQRAYMMYFYGAAIIGVFTTLLLMHINAYRHKPELELDELERISTLQSISQHFTTVFIAVLSILVLYLTDKPGFSGIVYFLMPVLHFFVGLTFAKKISRIKEQNTPQNIDPKNQIQ